MLFTKTTTKLNTVNEMSDLCASQNTPLKTTRETTFTAGGKILNKVEVLYFYCALHKTVISKRKENAFPTK